MQPQQYERTTDFTERDGDDTDHASINAEFDAAALTVEQIRDNLALIQRDDGALKNGIVTADALDDSAFDAVLINVNEAVQDAQQSASSALTSATTALGARDAAIAAKTASETARDVTILNANNASASALAASNSQTAAALSQSDAAASKASATASQTAAATSATSAATSATTATTQAGIATTKAADALASATASASSAAGAQTAKTAAETARDGAQTARTGAEAARDTAVAAKDAAQVSQSAASTSASSAGTSATTATTKAAEASASATSAASSATTATTQATTATTKAAESAASAASALASKNAAATSETNAAASQVSAASSAAAAASSYDSFDDRYLGPKATAPTLDNDGNALLIGALYFNTTTNAMQVYGSSGWTAAGSSVNGTSRRFRYIATAGQTTFTGVDSNSNTLAYDAGYVDVYLNGSRLDQTDYTASSGTSIVLGVAAALNDELNIVAFGTFNVANMNGNDLQAGTVTYAKIQNVTAGKVLGRDTSSAGTVQELPIAVDASGNVSFGDTTPSTITTGVATLTLGGTNANVSGGIAYKVNGVVKGFHYIDSDGLLAHQSISSGLKFVAANTEQARVEAGGLFKFNSGYGSVATAYGCRAWVNFNGTGVSAIRAQGNVSSITDRGNGLYTVNLSTAMPDANYCAIHGLGSNSSDDDRAGATNITGTSTINLSTSDQGPSDNSFVDCLQVFLAVFR